MVDESDSESSAALDFLDGNSIVGRDFVSTTFDDPGWRVILTEGKYSQVEKRRSTEYHV